MESTLESSQITSKPSSRHAGLDLLKVISIMMVLMCHTFGFASTNIVEGTPDYYGRYIITAFCIVMINCFILCSGYFLCTQKFRLSRLFKMTLVTFFWLLVAFIYILNTSPEVDLGNELLILFLPVTTMTFWFYSAYIALYLLSPIFNIAIRHMSKGVHLLTCVTLVVMSTLIDNAIGRNNAFFFVDGYNVWWFVVLYFVAAYLRLYVDVNKIKLWLPIIGYLLFTGLIIGHWLFLNYLVANNEWYAARFETGLAFNYNSFFVFFSSLSFFLIFLKINMKNKVVCFLISQTASHTLAIYIMDRSGGSFFSYNLALQIVNIPDLIIVSSVLAMLLIFIIRLSADIIRSLLFKLFEDRKWYKSFLYKLDQFPYWVVNKLNEDKGEKTT